jgi:hypothetical protein
MHAFTSQSTPILCRWCGAYGFSQHSPTCQPGRVPRVGRMRGAARDSRISAAVVARIKADEFVMRSLGA